MMRKKLTLVLVLGIATGLATGRADTFTRPRPKMFASAGGDYGFKLLLPEELENKRQSYGVLFTLEGRGKEKVIWERALVNVPGRVLLADNRFVVTIDTYANMGWEHSLVIYNKEGRVVRDFRLEDLLTDDEIAKNVFRTSPNRWWAKDAEFSLHPNPFDPKELKIEMKWGKVIRIDLWTGKITIGV